MDTKKYTLLIEGVNDSFEIPNLTMNGTNYVSESEVDTSKWPETFAMTATDEDGNVTEQHDHARLVQQVPYDWDEGKYYLAFAIIPAEEIIQAKMQSQLEYLAMMTDVDIDI